MLRVLLSLCLCCISINALANAAPKVARKIKHVIYITFDGTRWQDVFVAPSKFPIFWEKYAKLAHFYGLPDNQTTMEVASIPVSLPSYQSQTTGAIQPCWGNGCGRVPVETFAETILQKLQLKPREVVTFASWWTVGLAAEHNLGATFTNTGNLPVLDPDTHVADSIMLKLNSEQIKDTPDGANRYDKYTFAQAFHYFEKYKPTFMWISLLDSDEAAHAKNLEKYNQALSLYDAALDQLFKLLQQLKLNEETMILVTTDHGRGDGEHWNSHGPEFPESKQTWAFVINGELIPVPDKSQVLHYSTLSIRPTIEKTLLAL